MPLYKHLLIRLLRFHILMCWLLPPTLGAVWAQPVSAVVKDAERYQAKGELKKAVAYLNTAIERKPNRPELYEARANCFEQLGQLKTAIQDLKMAWRLSPTQHAYGLLLAQLYFREGYYPLAIETYTELLQMPTETTNAIYFREEIGADGQAAGAVGAFTLESSQAELYHGRGLAYAALNSHRNAIDNYRKAIDLQPNKAAFYVNRSECFMALSEVDSAIRDLEIALRYDSDNSLALNKLARISKLRGRSQGVRSALDRAIMSDSSFAPAFVNRGVAHLEAGNYTKALSDFDQAIAKGMHQAEVFLNRGIAHQMLGNWEEALQDLNLAVRLAPEWYKPYFTRGNVLYKLKRYQSALEDYHAAVGWAPELARVYFNRALAQHALGENTAACQDLQQALQLGMKSAEAPLRKWCP